jgi:hypothetical protein
VKEQSHKDEMSAALRGDFERLRERGVATTLSPAEQHTEPDTPAEPPVDEPVAEPPPDEPAASPAEDAPPARTGVFARLFGR